MTSLLKRRAEMKIPLRKIKRLPPVVYSSQFPYMDDVLQVIDDQNYNLEQYRKYISYLEDKIAELQKRPKKPKVKPSTLDQKGKKKKKGKQKTTPKEVEVHKEVTLSIKGNKKGWRFKGYKKFLVQDLKVETCNTLYKRERWIDPDGNEVVAPLPKELENRHFGPQLVHWILYQYHHAHVTIPLLHQHLCELGLKISIAEINYLLLNEVNRFSEEANACFEKGVNETLGFGVDDTSARVEGKNRTCLYIGNHYFSQFLTQGSKSRLSFLEALCEGELVYRVNEAAFSYLRQHGSHKLIASFSSITQETLPQKELLDLLKSHPYRSQRIAQEATLMSELLHRWKSKEKFIMSDGAKQYNLFSHATCWIHAVRLLEKVSVGKSSQEKVEEILNHLKKYYHFLKLYQVRPRELMKKRLVRLFDLIADLGTGDKDFESAFSQFISHKSELLLVLEHPEIPLHNNLAEQSLREVVIRRKISGGAKNDRGTEARDLFCSLKQTCRKLNISFWSYLKDRILGSKKIAPLPKILSQKFAAAPGF